VPMPLNNAVLDFHPLGVIDTPAGPRQRVVLVAAQRDMVERLVGAVRRAGLTPEGVDLSAFALIRSLYRAEPEQSGRILYLNVDGLTNLAIAEGTVCRFTRVVGSGLEGMATELAERRGIALVDARMRLAEANLSLPAPAPESAPAEEPVEEALVSEGEEDGSFETRDELEAQESELSYTELAAVSDSTEQTPHASDADVWTVLDNGIREISGEVRNSLDFHRSQDGGGDVSHVVLSGAAQDIPGFTDALQSSLGVEVRAADVSVVAGGLDSDISPHRLAVATGLAAVEAPR